ncbi:MAG: hypothetical protein ACUVWR_17040 [Anaerolineae bacterium]
MTEADKDRDVLRRLGARIAEIADLPVQREKADLWRRLNRLERVKPPVWINEICWNEMGDELALECEDEFCRTYEMQLRQILYQWQHLPADMVVDGSVVCPLVIHDSGYGIVGQETVPDHEFGARDYIPIIKTEADIERIKTPEIWVDRQATQRNHERLRGIFAGILPVVEIGAQCTWFAPWDRLVCYWGTTELMVDMVDRPELVERGIERMVEAELGRLDQLVAQNALSLNNNNVRVGSGGLGFSDELPQPDFDGVHARPIDMWSSATPQIFSEVSPAMHERFALRYERRWLERFGLNCYGCCEPLHKKIPMLAAQVPRLRRISISPRANVEEAAAAIEDKFIFSYKPNPSILAEEAWSPEGARQVLREALEKTRGCVVEVIMKDISTVRRQPQRLWEWAQIASEVTEEYG